MVLPPGNEQNRAHTINTISKDSKMKLPSVLIKMLDYCLFWGKVPQLWSIWVDLNSWSNEPNYDYCAENEKSFILLYKMHVLVQPSRKAGKSSTLKSACTRKNMSIWQFFVLLFGMVNSRDPWTQRLLVTSKGDMSYHSQEGYPPISWWLWDSILSEK